MHLAAEHSFSKRPQPDITLVLKAGVIGVVEEGVVRPGDTLEVADPPGAFVPLTRV